MAAYTETLQPITYRGRTVAAATQSRFFLADTAAEELVAESVIFSPCQARTADHAVGERG